MSVIFISSLDFIKSSFNQPTRFYKSAGRNTLYGDGPAQHASRQHVDPKIILLFSRFIWTGVQQVHFYFIPLCISGSPANKIILKMVQKSFVSGVSLTVLSLISEWHDTRKRDSRKITFFVLYTDQAISWWQKDHQSESEAWAQQVNPVTILGPLSQNIILNCKDVDILRYKSNYKPPS